MIPFIVPIIAGISGIIGAGNALVGGMKMKEADDILREIKARNEENLNRFNNLNQETTTIMDKLGILEVETLKQFNEFSQLIEKIHNKPLFKEYKKEEINLPDFQLDKIKEVSVAASAVLAGISGATLGTIGGIAASGAVTSVVMVLGTASTGTAISSLSGIAATNATLAVLGGGTLAAGGGGVSLGTTLLTSVTVGVTVLVAGVVFNIVSHKISDDANKAQQEVNESERIININCEYLNELKIAASEYINCMTIVRDKYMEKFEYIYNVVNNIGKVNWYDFTDTEKIETENLVLLVSLLYKMCQVNLVNKTVNDGEVNSVNYKDIKDSINSANAVLNEL